MPSRHVCSPVNLIHIFKIPFSKSTSQGLLLQFSNIFLLSSEVLKLNLKSLHWLKYLFHLMSWSIFKIPFSKSNSERLLLQFSNIFLLSSEVLKLNLKSLHWVKYLFRLISWCGKFDILRNVARKNIIFEQGYCNIHFMLLKTGTDSFLMGADVVY